MPWRELAVYHVYQQAMHYCDRIGPQGWLVVLAALIILGCACLRGFGSRSKY